MLAGIDKARGRAAFADEPLESFDPEGISAYEVKTRLAELEGHRREDLGARKVVG